MRLLQVRTGRKFSISHFFLLSPMRCSLLQATLAESLYELAGELVCFATSLPNSAVASPLISIRWLCSFVSQVRFLLRSGREYDNATPESDKLSPRFLGFFLFPSIRKQPFDSKRYPCRIITRNLWNGYITHTLSSLFSVFLEDPWSSCRMMIDFFILFFFLLFFFLFPVGQFIVKGDEPTYCFSEERTGKPR